MKHSKSSLFLMELIIAILFFSLSGTVCIQMFAKSHLLSLETVNQNHAVTWAQNLAEAYLGTQGDMEKILLLFPNGSLEENRTVLRLYWDSDWQQLEPSRAADASYIGHLEDLGYNGSAGLISADISIDQISGSEELYSLHIDHHIPERR